MEFIVADKKLEPSTPRANWKIIYNGGGLSFEGKTVFTKVQVAQILEIDERIVDRNIVSNGEELSKNGYHILRETL